MTAVTILGRQHTLPTLSPEVRAMLLSMAHDELGFDDLIKQITQNSELSKRLLQTANSARFSRLREIKTVNDAVVFLGFNAVRTLTIAIGVGTAIPVNSEIHRRQFWQHALSTATAARWIAEQSLPPLDIVISFTAGLLSRTGRLLLHAWFPDQTAQWSASRVVSDPTVLLEEERQLFQTDHAELGGQLAAHWSLPDGVAQAILHYPNPLAIEPVSSYAIVTHLAAYWVSAIEGRRSETEISAHFPIEISTRLGEQPSFHTAYSELRQLIEQGDVVL